MGQAVILLTQSVYSLFWGIFKFIFTLQKNNWIMLQHLKVRPHLTAALVLTGIIHFFLLPENWRTVTRLLTAWDFWYLPFTLY